MCLKSLINIVACHGRPACYAENFAAVQRDSHKAQWDDVRAMTDAFSKPASSGFIFINPLCRHPAPGLARRATRGQALPGGPWVLRTSRVFRTMGRPNTSGDDNTAWYYLSRDVLA
jgi:hypothetical protein